MQIPFADLLEHTKSEMIGARLWRMPPKTANTLHKHVRAEEFFFVLEGVGKIRIDGTTLTLPKHASVWVRPDCLRQIFNDSDREVL
jgi:mannose-6-phosphate isomerase-like protein (cupin superfamily)